MECQISPLVVLMFSCESRHYPYFSSPVFVLRDPDISGVRSFSSMPLPSVSPSLSPQEGVKGPNSVRIRL